MKKYACLCCGYLTISKKPPGTYEICPICAWEDDTSDGGANKVTLKKAKENFKKIGMSDRKCLSLIRKPTNKDKREPQWENLYYPQGK